MSEVSKDPVPDEAPGPVWHRFLDAQRRTSPVLLWALVVGSLAGLLGSVYRVLLDVLVGGRSALDHLPWPAAMSWVAPVASAAGLVWLSLWLVRRFAPEAAGSGVHEIEGALDGVRPVRWQRLLPVKFVGGLCSLASGLVLGREGPTIQMGGSSGRMVADLRRMDPEATHVLVAAGASAGLAAAFNAPFAGVLFVVEEMRPHFRYSMFSLQAVVVACAISDIVVRLVVGTALDVPLNPVATPPLGSLWLFALLGLLFGFLGVAFNTLLIQTLELFGRLRGRWFSTQGLWVGAAIGLLGWWSPNLTGDGERVIEQALAGALSLGTLAWLLVARFGTSVFSYGAGTPGGIFAPMLALGTLLGTAFGVVVDRVGAGLDPVAFAVAGMGALFAATVRAPLTGIALTMELTGAFNQVLPLMLTCATATLAAQWMGSPPIYTVLLRRSLNLDARREAPAADSDAESGSATH